MAAKGTTYSKTSMHNPPDDDEATKPAEPEKPKDESMPAPKVQPATPGASGTDPNLMKNQPSNGEKTGVR